ncbi:MAG: NAD(P)H-hydrate epimerase [Phycisphaeraceae bacterium]|nr:NAD(P)H-hydrate epimerase [Phycisphaeraceae bacterium]
MPTRRSTKPSPAKARSSKARPSGARPGVLVLTPSAQRQVDARCVRDYGLPTIVLMENAAAALAAAVLDELNHANAQSVLVVCGPGNNGGDGFAAARHLHNAGVPVAIYSTGPIESLAGDARVNAHVCAQMRLPIVVAGEGVDVLTDLRQTAALLGAPGMPGVVVDCVLGTGLSRAVAGELAEVIVAINALGRAGARVVSADVPSGLHAGTGQPMAEGPGEDPHAVRADLTVSFMGLKTGFLNPGAGEFTGDALIAPVGAPAELVERLGTQIKV